MLWSWTVIGQGLFKRLENFKKPPGGGGAIVEAQFRNDILCPR
jgi:hypothetical protein